MFGIDGQGEVFRFGVSALNVVLVIEVVCAATPFRAELARFATLAPPLSFGHFAVNTGNRRIYLLLARAKTDRRSGAKWTGESA